MSTLEAPPSVRPRSDGGRPVRVLVVDNYDSFVFNLVQYLGQLGADPVVLRNDEVGIEEALGYDAVLLSPGPGTPEAAGVCVDLVRAAAGRVPVLGVCLGHQAIGVAYGAQVTRAPELLHGKTSLVHHGGAGVLAGLPDPFTATRYHSLAIDPGSVPGELEVTGTTASGVIMAVRHRTLDVEGVQFHPESVLTEGGHRLLANWLVRCGDPQAVERSTGLAPVVG
ncbi:MAG TPA: aminodeoxychorismate/anthranilate synthase component II [Actinomycetes bacterium]